MERCDAAVSFEGDISLRSPLMHYQQSVSRIKAVLSDVFCECRKTKRLIIYDAL